MLIKIIIFSLLLVISFNAVASAELSEKEIKARIAELSNLSVRSASGQFIVVGTNRVESFALGNWSESVADQIKDITGIAAPFNKRWITLAIGRDNQKSSDGAFVRYSRNRSRTASRVYIGSYGSAYESSGRQAICRSILALYDGVLTENGFSLPAWLWKGIDQNILYETRSKNMEKVLSGWRQAKLPSIVSVIEASDADSTNSEDKIDLNNNYLAIYSAFVRFLSSKSNRGDIFETLFRDSTHINVSELESLLAGENSKILLDEYWERWLMHQSHVVRGATTVSLRIIEQIRSELLLYSGTYGIPLGVEIPKGSSLASLIHFRNEEWLPQYINRKKGQLSMIAAGQVKEVADVVGLYNEFLSSLEKGTSDILLLKQWKKANAALQKLSQNVKNN